MSMENEDVMFNMGEGCLAHGDEHMRECPTCGMEFCAKCHSGSAFCPECSDETNLDLDPEDEEDPELSAVSDLLEDVDEVDEEDPDAETDTERA